MEGVIIEDEETEYALQQAARESFVLKMLQEILLDMNICKLKGWDVMEYPNRIHEEVARVVLKYQQTTNCKGEPYKKFYKSPQCANCDAEVGFYRTTCPNCGATLDRKKIEKVAVNED